MHVGGQRYVDADAVGLPSVLQTRQARRSYEKTLNITNTFPTSRRKIETQLRQIVPATVSVGFPIPAGTVPAAGEAIQFCLVWIVGLIAIIVGTDSTLDNKATLAMRRRFVLSLERKTTPRGVSDHFSSQARRWESIGCNHERI